MALSLRMVGRATASRPPPTTEPERSRDRIDPFAGPCRKEDEDTERDGARARTSVRLPGRSCRARRAAMACGRALSTVGRMPGC